ncbi:MAG TPA: hypothetical protein PLV45_07405, partial [bacterium]|nr:hypothetical protein [bacterium]
MKFLILLAIIGVYCAVYRVFRARETGRRGIITGPVGVSLLVLLLLIVQFAGPDSERINTRRDAAERVRQSMGNESHFAKPLMSGTGVTTPVVPDLRTALGER